VPCRAESATPPSFSLSPHQHGQGVMSVGGGRADAPDVMENAYSNLAFFDQPAMLGRYNGLLAESFPILFFRLFDAFRSLCHF
jgi:hypothetical protein